jgi:hypothetical protein
MMLSVHNSMGDSLKFSLPAWLDVDRVEAENGTRLSLNSLGAFPLSGRLEQDNARDTRLNLNPSNTTFFGDSQRTVI